MLICDLAELRLVPLPGTFHPNRPSQRATGHHGWLGPPQ